jgi:hypothetical protein
MKAMNATEKHFTTKKLVTNNLLAPSSLEKKKTRDLSQRSHKSNEDIELPEADILKPPVVESNLKKGKFFYGT